MESLTTIWNAASELLNQDPSYVNTMLRDNFRLAAYNEKTQVFTVVVDNPFASAWLDGDKANQAALRELLRRVVGNSAIDFELKDEEDVPAEAEKSVPAAVHESVPAARVPAKSAEKSVPAPQLQSTINPENTFENFVTSSENDLANACALSVANDIYDRNGTNPLFIYGPSGIGKTHLLHAIANKVFREHPDVRMLYVSGESFTNDYIDALKSNNFEAFRNRYRRLHLLLVDDIQFLAGKKETMQEFFHTFNALILNGCKIVLTCDREASALELDDRLLSRFKQGVTADIRPPREAARAAILTQKAERKKFSFDNFREAFDFIVQKITRNVRNIEGALNTLINYIRLRRPQTLGPSELQQVLGTFVSADSSNNVISIRSVQEEVAKFYKMDVEDLCGKARTANIAYARQVAMSLCMELAKTTQTAVGAAFGNRDHGTVIHAVKKVRDIVETDAGRRKELEMLRIRLRK